MRVVKHSAGAARPTLDDVARLAGVSRSTASRALNGSSKVSAGAQTAVDRAIRQLGFTPNRAARALVTSRTDSIALVIPEPDELVLSDPFIGGVLQGLSRELRDTTIQLVLVISRPDEERDKLAQFLRRGHVDGAIIVSHHRDDRYLVALQQQALPRVFIGRPWLAATDEPYVDVDSVAAGRLATDALINAGCRRIGHIAGPLDMVAGFDRLAGYRQALDHAGMRADAYVATDFTSAGAEAAARELFDRWPQIDGLFAASDTLAIAAMKVARQRGRDVPHDLRVVGFDDLGAAADATPPLTTMVNPVTQMARIASQLLFDQIEGRDPHPAPVILSSTLVMRETV